MADRDDPPLDFCSKSSEEAHESLHLSIIMGMRETEGKRKNSSESQSADASNNDMTGGEAFGMDFPSIHDDNQDTEKVSSATDEEGGWDALFDAEQPLEDAFRSPVSIGVNEWMNTAIMNRGINYMQSAVNLAWLLTNHLIELQTTSIELKPEDITCDNLVVLVKPDVMSAIDEIEGVQFRFEDALSMPRTNNSDSAGKRMDPNLVCVPLGNILLKIFSKGQATSISVSKEDSENDLYQSGSDDQDVTMPWVAKRMAAVSLTRDTPYGKAEKLLFDMGTPTSICRLVCDLLDTINDEPSSPNSAAHITLEQGLCDLTQMKNHPQLFLFDRTSPEKALDDTCLFDNNDEQLFGRVREIKALKEFKESIFQHVSQAHSQGCTVSGDSRLYKAVFLSGYAGSGKSCLLRSLIKSSEEDKWFVLKGKFDSKSAPLRILANAFNEVFGGYAPPHQLDRSMLT